MDFGYDIFRKLDDGAPLWITQVPAFHQAKLALESLFRDSPGEYFVRDASSGDIVLRVGGIPPT